MPIARLWQSQVRNIWHSRRIRVPDHYQRRRSQIDIQPLACVKHSSCCARNSHRSQPLIKEDMTGTLTVIFKYEHRQSTTPISNLMSSSPAMSNHDPSHWKDSNDTSPESLMCDCQSQLKHYDMNGDPYRMRASVPWEYLLKMSRLLKMLQWLSWIPSGGISNRNTVRLTNLNLQNWQCCSESYSSKTEGLGKSEWNQH